MIAGQIDPEIADRLRRRAREAAHQRERHREAGRGRQEVVHGEAEHLGEMTHRRLAAVVLPVGVGDEADRGVEGEIGRDRVEAPRVQRQDVLQPLQRVEREEAGDGENDHRDRVAEPVLLARRIDAGEAVEAAFDRPQNRGQESPFAREHPGDERAERHGARHDQGERQRDLQPAGKRHREALEVRIFRDGSGCRAGRGRAARPRPVRRSVRSSSASPKAAAGRRRRTPSVR